MKFLDKAFNKFVTWFDPEEETERSIARSAASIRRFHESLEPEHQESAPSMPPVKRLKMPTEYRGLGTWEAQPDPFDPEQKIEIYVPALEEMSQQELGRIVSARVAANFADNEPTIESERIRYAVYRIAAFSDANGYILRDHDDLFDDTVAVIEACRILVKFVEQEIENSADPVDDVALSDFLRAAQYLITMANRTYVSVIAKDSISHPYANWEYSLPSSLPCWPGLADLAGKEAA